MSKNEQWVEFASEYVVSLFPVSMMADALAEGVQEHIGKSVDLAEKLENHSAEYYYRPNNWLEAHNALTEIIKKNPDFLASIFAAIRQEGRKQVAFARNISNQNLRKLSNKQLAANFRKYSKLNTNLYTYGILLPVLDFQTTTFISDEIAGFLKSKNSSQYFNLLTNPVKDSYNQLHELNLLKIFSEIKKNKTLYDHFKKMPTGKLTSSQYFKKSKAWQMISSHTKQYAWIHYVYEGPPADAVYFIDIIKDFVRRRVDPQKAIDSHDVSKQKLKQQQADVIRKLTPGRYYKRILQLGQEVVYYKAYRRDLQTASYYHMSFVFKEIARRLNVTLRQIRMMLPEEVATALLQDELDLLEINERIRLSIYVRSGKTRKILTGQAAQRFLLNAKKETFNDKVKKIIGATAHPGKVRGVARIINTPEDMVKMNRGEILISASTSPNLMPAILKAAAIVTNEGGLTCHAAIVSREFKIPCVVGTQFATQVLKDGDRVEVDAGKGIVRKL